jgi:hypothetical protein
MTINRETNDKQTNILNKQTVYVYHFNLPRKVNMPNVDFESNEVNFTICYMFRLFPVCLVQDYFDSS